MASGIEGLDARFVPRLHLAKGTIRTRRQAAVSASGLSMPSPGGLGIHFTLDLTGAGRFGPDVEWIDGVNYDVDPARAAAFHDSIRRYWPDMTPLILQAAYGRSPVEGPAVQERISSSGPAEHGCVGLINLFGIISGLPLTGDRRPCWKDGSGDPSSPLIVVSQARQDCSAAVALLAISRIEMLANRSTKACILAPGEAMCSHGPRTWEMSVGLALITTRVRPCLVVCLGRSKHGRTGSHPSPQASATAASIRGSTRQGSGQYPKLRFGSGGGMDDSARGVYWRRLQVSATTGRRMSCKAPGLSPS